MAMQGDVQQQGGAFVMGPGRTVHFAHHDQGALDHCNIDVLLEQAGLPPFFKPTEPTPPSSAAVSAAPMK
jgi:hypothetical protein